MAVNFVAVKCPACGANLNIEEGRNQMFCSYCGTNIMITNDNEHTYRYVNEAKIKEAETDRLVKLKQLEMAEQQRTDDEKKRRLKINASIAMAAVGVVFMLIGASARNASILILIGLIAILSILKIWSSGSKKEENNSGCSGYKIKIPKSINGFESKNYAVVEELFRNAGFTNVRSVPLGDLTLGFLNKPGLISTVSVNGKEISSGGKKFPSDSSVIISYHSFANR